MNKYEEYLKMKRWDSQFRYMLLDRMRLDCDYLLDNVANHLWAGNITDQIGYMKALWESFPADEKPEWLTMEQINEYEQKMSEAGNFEEEN